VTRYYFDIVEGEDRTLDDVGLELADKGAARAHGASLLIEIARDSVRCGNLSALSVEVRNEVGQPAFHVMLRFHLSDQA
jgi:hypothetical protein